MALDCSPGKQIFLTWWKDIFKVFCIYIYQTLPFVGYLFIFFLNLMDGQSSDICEYC